MYGAHRIGVGVDVPHPPRGSVEHDRRAVGRRRAGGGLQYGQGRRPRSDGAERVAGLHGGAVVAAFGINVAGAGGGRPGGFGGAVAEVETVFELAAVGVGGGGRQRHTLAGRHRIKRGGERGEGGRVVAPNGATGREGEGITHHAVAGRVLDATGRQHHLIGGVGHQGGVRNEGQDVVERKGELAGDGAATEGPHDKRGAVDDGFGFERFVDQQADRQAHGVIRAAGLRDMETDRRTAGIGRGLVGPDGHALMFTDAAGDDQVAERQQELRGVDVEPGAVQLQHGFEGAQVDLVAAHKGEFVLELHIHRFVAGQWAVGEETQIGRIGSVDHPETIAAGLVGEDDVELAVAAPKFGPIPAGAAGIEHVEQHRVGRVGDVVSGNAGAALVGGEDQEVAHDEGMADHPGLCQVVPFGERAPVLRKFGQSFDGAITPIGGGDVPGAEKAAAMAGAVEVGVGGARIALAAAGAEGPGGFGWPVGAEHEVFAAVEIPVGRNRHGGNAELSQLDRSGGVRDVPGAYLEIRIRLTRRQLRHGEEDAVVVGQDGGAALLRRVEAGQQGAGHLGDVGETRSNGRLGERGRGEKKEAE